MSTIESAPGIVVFIPAALKRPTHTLYSICVKVDETPEAPASEWTVNRRYSQFLEMRDKVIRYLERNQGCPGCASIARAIATFPFPGKAWFRTNKLVRHRVRDLQAFIQTVINHTYSPKPKCNTCGAGLQTIVRPFFYRGAQPIHRLSTSIFNSSYNHREKSKDSDCSTMHSAKDMADLEFLRPDASQRRLRVSQSLTDSCRTLIQKKCSFIKEHNHESNDSYLNGNTKCTDVRPSVAEALKNVVIADGFANTKQEKMYRLSTMWESFELEDIQREMTTSRYPRDGILI
ncbi:hypothetical protein THRCLA_07412 [Thraustotheca clavata]|uniref:PX domain-containing protein n=1 Tax=Thraustotheca clavata TaxID=74557 RepID=A0A1V9ZDM8_9STRA|nr:hypothetical protein THRCLA_07412 [Thraustotheca clavata]